MKFSFTALAISLVTIGADARESNMAEIRSKRRLTKEFMHAMRQPQIEAARKKGQAQKIRKLHENLMHASRKLSYNQYDQYAQQAYDQQQQYQQQQQEYYNQQQENQQQADEEQQEQQEAQDQYQYQYEQQAQQGEQDWAQYYQWDDNQIPFDLTSRSFKYSGCAAIKTYDQERAEENGNPMVVDTYAVFRLCPADSCNEYSITGCGRNYGEYAIEMNNYLTYILNYYDSVYEQYCEYCEGCDWEYEAEVKTALQQCYQDVQQMQWMENQNQGANNYQDYYNNNNNNYNANVNYNGQANANYNGQANANYDGNNGGGRKMQQNYGYGQGNYYNNGGAQNGQQMNQNAQAYGYYDQDGQWVAGQGGANAMSGYWGQDGNYYPYDGNMQSMYSAMYQCKDGSMCDYCTWQMEQQYMSCDENVCGDYYTYCSDLYGNDVDFDPKDYLECQPYENQYGQLYYIGPHCGSDHFTVSLGVFSDENCLNYIGETVSLSSILGFNYDDTDIFKLPKECISCDGTEQYIEQQQEQGQQEEEEENQNQGSSYVSSPETTEDGIVAMCYALYEGSAQCNMNMNNFKTISRYMSQYEIDQEKRYCAFIKNIISGAYDESGEIMLKAEDFDFADWRNVQQYKKLSMPASQAVGLALSMILVIALAAMAAFTSRSLSRQSTPWRPASPKGDSLSRQNSGIVMGRSRSGPGAAPLI